MGRIVSPVGTRAGTATLWLDSWVAKNWYYSEMFLNSIKVKNYLKFKFNKGINQEVIGLYAYSKLSFSNNSLLIKSYFHHDAGSDELREFTRIFNRRFIYNYKYKTILDKFLKVFSEEIKFGPWKYILALNVIKDSKLLLFLNLLMFHLVFFTKTVFQYFPFSKENKKAWDRHLISSKNINEIGNNSLTKLFNKNIQKAILKKKLEKNYYFTPPISSHKNSIFNYLGAEKLLDKKTKDFWQLGEDFKNVLKEKEKEKELQEYKRDEKAAELLITYYNNLRKEYEDLLQIIYLKRKNAKKKLKLIKLKKRIKLKKNN